MGENHGSGIGIRKMLGATRKREVALKKRELALMQAITLLLGVVQVHAADDAESRRVLGEVGKLLNNERRTANGV